MKFCHQNDAIKMTFNLLNILQLLIHSFLQMFQNQSPYKVVILSCAKKGNCKFLLKMDWELLGTIRD